MHSKNIHNFISIVQNIGNLYQWLFAYFPFLLLSFCHIANLRCSLLSYCSILSFDLRHSILKRRCFSQLLILYWINANQIYVSCILCKNWDFYSIYVACLGLYCYFSTIDLSEENGCVSLLHHLCKGIYNYVLIVGTGIVELEAKGVTCWL